MQAKLVSKKKLSKSKNKHNNFHDVAKKILNEYYLCTACTGRLFAKKLGLASNKHLGKKIHKSLKIKSSGKCFVCKNILLNTKSFVDEMIAATSDYEFSTFLVGAILKPSTTDNDDIIRSRYGLRGVDSVKTDFTKQLGKIFSKKTRSKIDYLNPEITITINIKDDSCQVKSKPLILFGKYTKTKRGIPQKEKPCSNCGGIGCNFCKKHGICTFDSIEGKIAKVIFTKFGAEQIKVTWIGGEDKSSLVLNKGRPFFVKVINPKKRNVKLAKKITDDNITILDLKKIRQPPKRPLLFRTNIELHVQTSDTITQKELKSLDSLVKNTIVVYDKNKRNEKFVYSAKHKICSKNSFSLWLVVDGGMPIKRFVEGQDVFPNLSDLIGTKCICQEFDFHEIKLIKTN